MKDTDSKDKLVAAVKDSFAFCGTAFDKVDDSKLGDPIKDYSGEAPTTGMGADRVCQFLC